MIVVADVHGCYKTLMKLMEQFPSDEQVIFVGDLVDRGMMSREVVQFVIDGGYDCVLGNHEQLMMESIEEYSMGIYDRTWKVWQENGGENGLSSYRGHTKAMVNHLEWFKTLPLLKTYEVEGHKDLLVTHAPSVSYIDLYFAFQEKLKLPWGELSQVDRDALNMDVGSFCEWMIWYRKLPSKGSEKYFGVSGHNVFNTHPDACIQTKTIINKDIGFASIDTGVCFPDEPFGILTAIQYPSLKLFQQPLLDDVF